MVDLRVRLDLLVSQEKRVQREPREETEYLGPLVQRASKARKDSRACKARRGHQEQMVSM